MTFLNERLSETETRKTIVLLENSHSLSLHMIDFILVHIREVGRSIGRCLVQFVVVWKYSMKQVEKCTLLVF